MLVSTVPSTNRLQSHPAGGAFKSFVDEDDLGHISVVVETNREVDGEVDSVALALAGQDLTVTVGRTVGADLTATQTLPGGGLPLTGGTLTGIVGISPGDVNSVALTITKVTAATTLWCEWFTRTIKPPPANGLSTPAATVRVITSRSMAGSAEPMHSPV